MKIFFPGLYPDSTWKSHHPLFYFIVYHLQLIGHDVQTIGDLDSWFSQIYRIKSFYYKILKKQNYSRERELRVVKSICKTIESEFLKSGCDLILAPGSSYVSYVDEKIPTSFWTDATFDMLHNYNPSYTNLAASNVRNGNIIEQSALERTKLAVFSSKEAANSAINSYHINQQIVKILPFGPGLKWDSSFDKENVINNIQNKKLDQLKLLFVATDWINKGGPKILESMRLIKSYGMDIVLDLVGVRPEIPNDLKQNVILHGFLNKNISTDLVKLKSLLFQAHFYIQPSISEAYGMVFCEANMAGLPCIATRTGGIPSIISNGKNGFLLSPEANAKEIADIILNIWNSPDQYYELCKSSYSEFRKRLNWEKSVLKLSEMLKSL